MSWFSVSVCYSLATLFAITLLYFWVLVSFCATFMCLLVCGHGTESSLTGCEAKAVVLRKGYIEFFLNYQNFPVALLVLVRY